LTPFFGDLGQSGIESQQLSALRESVFFGAVGEKAEVTDAHETIGQDVEQEAADEFFGIESLRFQPVFISLKAKSGLDPISGSCASGRRILSAFSMKWIMRKRPSLCWRSA